MEIAYAERPHRVDIEMTYTNYFNVAVWVPAIMLPILLVLDGSFFLIPLDGGVEQFILVYILGFGTVAYILFAAFVSCVIPNKSKSELMRLAWWAPVIFIPFYGGAWILYGVGCFLLGSSGGLGMMLVWLAFIPYFLSFGVMISAITVLLFKLMDKYSLFSNREC